MISAAKCLSKNTKAQSLTLHDRDLIYILNWIHENLCNPTFYSSKLGCCSISASVAFITVISFLHYGYFIFFHCFFLISLTVFEDRHKLNARSSPQFAYSLKDMEVLVWLSNWADLYRSPQQHIHLALWVQAAYSVLSLHSSNEPGELSNRDLQCR